MTRLLLVAVALGSLTGSAASLAQGVNCEDLAARIEASSGQAARAGQFASALRRQEDELQRLQAYADSAGCNADFLFNTSPAQCDAITSRLARLQGGIDRMQEQMEQTRGEDPRALTERYDTYCAAGAAQTPADDAPRERQVMPVDPDADTLPPDGDGAPAVTARPRRVRALCVRECDGGFFPVTDDASSGAVEDLDRLCKALCPNTKATLYTTAPFSGIETAVDKDGTPYSSLPAAFKFQKTFDATCSCKPPHQSWVQALAEAETLIEGGHGDVTVTQKMSDAMAKPGAPQAGKPAPIVPKASGKTKIARQTKLSPPADPDEPIVPPPPAQPDAQGDDLMRQLRRDEPTL